MDREEVDQAIVGLTAAYDRISAAMYTVDGHPSLEVLRGGGFAGETKRVADETLSRIGILWSRYAALHACLDQAKAVRAQRTRPGDTELRELTALLREPVVGLDAAGAVVEDGPATSHIAVADLATGLESGAAEVMTALNDVASARTRLAARFMPLTDALARARSTVESTDPELDRLGDDIAAAHRDASADPLGTGTSLDGRLAELTRRAEAVSARVAELTSLRDGFPRRAELLASTVDELATTERAVGETFALVREKIANPGLPELPDSAPPLRAHLTQLQQLYEERRWTRLAAELAAVDRTVAAALARVGELRSAADGLLDRRTELRGRLSAYQARAARLGVVEHSELSARHREAQDLLYTSPCDLPAATRAVVAYQRCLNDLTERESRT